MVPALPNGNHREQKEAKCKPGELASIWGWKVLRATIVIKLIKLLSSASYYVHISIHLINHNMWSMVNNQI